MRKHAKQLLGQQEAIRLQREAMSPRACEIAELERWYDGRQYDDLPDWLTSSEHPLFERGPCIVYPFARSAISSHVDLVLGKGRFPDLKVASLEDHAEVLEGETPNADELEVVNRFVMQIAKQSRLARVCRHALTAAMATRSACIIFGSWRGKLRADLVKSRWCEPELNDDGAVEKLVIEYPYTKAEQQPDGQWRLKAYMFRREIDDRRDITMQPFELRAGVNTSSVRWVEDPSRSGEHGLGFCPVVWYPFDKGCDVEGRIDGKALHEDLLDEIYAHDFALSLRHRSAIYAGEPQWVETGVQGGYNPTDTGALPHSTIAASSKGGAYTDSQGDNPLRGVYRYGSQPEQGRKKSPDTVWQFPPGADAKLVALGADALGAIDDHARDLRIKLAEAAAVVFLDPGDIKYAAALSGKALETLRGRQLSRCDQIRDDVEDGLLIPSMQMMLRIVATLRESVRVPGVARALPLLAKYSDEDSVAPPFSCVWPSYFDTDNDEIDKVAKTVRADLDAGIIRRQTAIEKMSDFYGIEDVDAYVEALEEERASAAEQLHKTMKLAAGDDLEEENGSGAAAIARGRGRSAESSAPSDASRRAD